MSKRAFQSSAAAAAAAAAKSLQSCRLCATPQMAAHQAPPFLGFSRQEHWSGVPLPSPMHESKKVQVKSLSRVPLLATSWTEIYQAPPSMGFSRQEYWSGVPLPAPTTYKIDKQQGYVAQRRKL